MPVCAKVVESEGAFFLALEPAVTNIATCAYVVQSGTEVGANPFSMSAEDGGIISVGLVSCWAAAYGIRSLISTVRGSSFNETNS